MSEMNQIRKALAQMPDNLAAKLVHEACEAALTPEVAAIAKRVEGLGGRRKTGHTLALEVVAAVGWLLLEREAEHV